MRLSHWLGNTEPQAPLALERHWHCCGNDEFHESPKSIISCRLLHAMSARQSRPNRPVDTIYCEAKCPDEDVFYFGSDDDQYENPRERKRRYELAGQRFLAGSTPRLLSSSLRGPFESSKGWRNPWASKKQPNPDRPIPPWARISWPKSYTTAPVLNHVDQGITHPASSKEQPNQERPPFPWARIVRTNLNTTAQLPNYTEQLTTHAASSNPECHLPSPRSLNTASLSSERHAFLDDEDLNVVQAWRHSVQESEPTTTQAPVQADSQACGAAVSRKRKAGHNWLRTVAPKKPRVEASESISEGVVMKSFASAPERLESSRPIPCAGQPSLVVVKEEPRTANTALQPTTKLIKREFTSQLISPPKQQPKTKNPASPTVPNNEHGEKLSRDAQAAATLSSPVSLRKVKQEKMEAQPSPLKFKGNMHNTSNSSDSSSAESRSKSPSPASNQGASNIHNGNPVRAFQDEEFVINVTLDSCPELPDLSDSDDEELSELSELSDLSESENGSDRASDAVSEEAQPRPTTLENESCSENDNTSDSDSDLTELSYSPDISELGECAEDAESSAEAGDELEEDTESRATGGLHMVEHEESSDVVMAEAATEAAGSSDTDETDASTFINPVVAEEATDTEILQHTINSTESKEVIMTHDEPRQIEDSRLSNIDGESAHASDTVINKSAILETVVNGPETAPANNTCSSALAPEEQQDNEEIPTSAADALTQPFTTSRNPIEASPKIKQEPSEFSLKAMLKSFVPTSKWVQLTRLTSSTVQHSLEVTQECVLPSVEAENVVANEQAVTNSEVGAEESSVPASSSYEAVIEQANKRCRLPSGQVCDAALPAPQTPRRSTPELVTDNTVAPTCHALSPKHQQNGATRGLSMSATEETGESTSATIHNEPEQLSAEASTLSASSKRPSAAPVESHLSGSAATTPPPPSTPTTDVHAQASKGGTEPRFTFKSFAAFSTPSPERLRVRKRHTLPGSRLRHPGLSGILSSREPGAARRTNNRVSWAILPGEEGPCTAATSNASSGSDDDAAAAHVPKALRGGRSSPPPRTPLAELPTASNEKFGKHFSSVVKRTDGLRHRFHVSADIDSTVDAPTVRGAGGSQSQSQSQGSSYVAKSSTSSSFDAARRDAPGDDAVDVENRDAPLRAREATMSVEPMDMVEDMVREMGDFWQAWDVDAELDAAKKTQSDIPTLGSQSQQTWR